MDRLKRSGAPGMEFSTSERLCFCDTCATCKSRVIDINREPQPDPDNVFEVVGLDMFGPVQQESLGGNRYSLAAVDFKSRYILQDLLRTKAEAVATFRRFLAKIKSWGYSVLRLHEAETS